MRTQKKEGAEIFNADATYMQVTYGAQAFDSEAEFHIEQDEALNMLDWDVADEGWGNEFWADIVTTRTGETLAVVADGAWGQPGTYYHAILEIEIVPTCPQCEMNNEKDAQPEEEYERAVAEGEYDEN